MAKTRSDTTPSAGPNGPAKALLSLNPLAGPQLHQFWDMQEKLLNEAELFAKHWFERRHTAARTALQATASILGAGSSDPASAATVLRDWQAKSAERIAEDMQEWVELCTRSAEVITSAEVAANRETMETVSDTMKDAGHRHATPV